MALVLVGPSSMDQVAAAANFLHDEAGLARIALEQPC